MVKGEKTFDPNPESTRLAGNVSIRKYREMIQRQDRAAIADLVQRRFEERYLDAVLLSSKRHGFAVLSVCCLMVEALESFRQGWPRSDGKSETAFCAFFEAHNEFGELRPVAHEFYRAVRCGILHQAETTHGWRVHQGKGPLLVERSGVRWVSAWEFARRLKAVLGRYRKELAESDWTSPVWVKTRAKLRSICRNCGVADVTGLA